MKVSRSSYYRNCGENAKSGNSERQRPVHPDRILLSEREAVIDYARQHPDIRHRALAWHMVDDNVAFVSASTVYRILVEAKLICVWQPVSKRVKRSRHNGNGPDDKWQSDIRYVKIKHWTFYLIIFIDEYSRYIVYHELMLSMDGNSVSLAALDALSTLENGEKPLIQTDNGSGYVSHEFKLVLSDKGVGHHRIYPHCPEENGLVERSNRTLGEKIDELDLEDFQEAKHEIAAIIDWYNTERLHSAINYLTPYDMYRGNPEQRLEERKNKLAEARQRRREENLNVNQRNLALETVNCTQLNTEKKQRKTDKNRLLKEKRKNTYVEKPLLNNTTKLSHEV